MVQRTLSESRGWDSAVDAYERRVKAEELSETRSAATRPASPISAAGRSRRR